MSLGEQEQVRRKALDELITLGINPYPPEMFQVNVNAKDIHDNYERKKIDYKNISIAGRIVIRRIMGKASFMEIQDSTGRIQVYVNRDELCPDEDKTFYNTVFKRLLDMGDIIGIRGFVFTTKTGEITIHAKELILLAKSLRPLPTVKEKDGVVYDAFTDAEQRYRQRYLDLIVNPDVRSVFIKRSQLIEEMRHFMNERGYLEVETPVLQPIYGGAAARPFKTHHNTLDVDLYLRIANELYLKRLIVGGFDGVFEFAKDFRNEGMDPHHNPEFTQMELYVAYKDYYWMMDLVEEMFEKIALKLHNSTIVQVGENKIDFQRPWKRYSMTEAIQEFANIDISEMDEESLAKAAKKLGIEIDKSLGKAKIIDEIFSAKCEPNLIQPTFINDYPVEMSPLAKKTSGQKRIG